MASESNSYRMMTCSNAKLYSEASGYANNAIEECLDDCRFKNGAHRCRGELSYGAGDLGSYLDYELVFERIGLGGITTGSTFGCVYDAKDFDEGIWGLSYEPDNEYLEAVHRFDQAMGYDPQRLFTICTNGTDAVLNVGAIDERFHVG
jgi:hypothetical protein